MFLDTLLVLWYVSMADGYFPGYKELPSPLPEEQIMIEIPKSDWDNYQVEFKDPIRTA